MDGNIHWFWKFFIPIFVNVAVFGFLIYACVSPQPFPCDGQDDPRENCLDEKEWEEYYNKVLKDRKGYKYRWKASEW